ncbi:ribosome biogenesis GTPase Der [Chlamydia muridarum str. Nigg]|jgi:ribosome-associated GTPase EngA|uniref:GTPase Der n=2 Tax=Chlamydia muridarum TaxID=83560 RepID=DER_CHLMU|nr:ribosome biogenesis GTPase Der [Chlamydia muridarum]Q9PLM3.1 RecName: Full=GTPase Der; AltName: Full=GTP-binding protein EngA [Chlamydia muridarum str. Nigg]UFT96765.1 ribosome biogenesis GTPase Der [Chlamydia trachomatis]AAF38958.1 GTP-binding protein, Era/ThdF family [Chlamydia muridarum str. Nigg]AHH22474.1 GTP-binding protein Der [Chlamydia muridarum str. Nigg3 CMUT3-5]AHH23398.1 GTP-binding protein Der [Chlamydia muridarum str. Nigg CM972]AID37626.1 GTP-binding protein Der [Chlamydia 
MRIAILGRPNVGKSSIFNRLCKRSLAIVNAQEGTTRDRLYGEIRAWDSIVHVIDTGGVDQESTDRFQKQIHKQALAAAEEASVLLLVVDIRCGITKQDEELAKRLLPLKKPLILVMNKADSQQDLQRIHEFYGLGISNMIATSASHDKHIDVLLERIRQVAEIPLPSAEEQENTQEEEFSSKESSVALHTFADETLFENESLSQEEASFLEELVAQTTTPSISNRPLKVALIGHPNVGKSSIVNALLKEERCITDNSPGTTRDNVDVSYTYNDKEYVFIDTAGLRKAKSIKNSVEWMSSSRTEKAISRADICLLVIDATQQLSYQDKRILSLIARYKKPHVILVNKWDLMFGVRMEHYVQDLRKMDPYIGQARILCISAKQRRNLSQIFSAVDDVYTIATTKLSTSLVNKVLAGAMQRHHPQVINGKRLRIYYAIHKTVTPFSFLLFINSNTLLTKPYELYLKNTLKAAFNLYGIPFDLEYKAKPARKSN